MGEGASRAPCRMPCSGDQVSVGVGDQVAHQPHGERHEYAGLWPPETRRPDRTKKAWVGEYPRERAGEQECVAISAAEKVRPEQCEVFGIVEHTDGHPSGFQAVINAFTVEGVDAGGGVANERPVGSRDVANGTSHRQEGTGHGGRLP